MTVQTGSGAGPLGISLATEAWI